jgi:hypothetical protein
MPLRRARWVLVLGRGVEGWGLVEAVANINWQLAGANPGRTCEQLISTTNGHHSQHHNKHPPLPITPPKKKQSMVSPLVAAAISNQTIQESMRLVMMVRAYQVIVNV